MPNVILCHCIIKTITSSAKQSTFYISCIVISLNSRHLTPDGVDFPQNDSPQEMYHSPWATCRNCHLFPFSPSAIHREHIDISPKKTYLSLIYINVFSSFQLSKNNFLSRFVPSSKILAVVLIKVN